MKLPRLPANNGFQIYSEDESIDISSPSSNRHRVTIKAAKEDHDLSVKSPQMNNYFDFEFQKKQTLGLAAFHQAGGF